MTEFHITRATLAPATRNLGALLADSGNLDAAHRLVWTLFPGDDARRDFVYRSAGNNTYFIVSQRPAVDEHKLWRLDARPYAPEATAGERYAFILRANPSKDIKRDGRRSTRVDAIMHAKMQFRRQGERWTAEAERHAALEWLFAREALLGVRFQREACDASNYTGVVISPKKTATDQQPIRYATVDFEGLLEVDDGVAFAERLKYGIGHARAFGCGLMLIRRALPS